MSTAPVAEPDTETVAPPDEAETEIKKLITKSKLSAWVKQKSIGVFERIAIAEGKIHGMPPAEADMQRYFEVSGPSVHNMVMTLEKRWLIARTPGAARSLRLLLSRDQLPDLA